MIPTALLIAANDTDVAHELGEHLVRLGYKVLGYVSSKQELVAKAQELQPDLLLVDLQLSTSRENINTGALNRFHITTPIIYIGGSVGQNTIQRAQVAGPFGYIFTPFDEKQIYATLETALLRHHLEGQLREGRRWLHAVLNGIGDGVIALDGDGDIRFINPVAQQLTGWTEIETVNKTLEEVFPLTDEITHETICLDPQKAGTRLEGQLVSKLGQSLPVEAELTVIEAGGGTPMGMVLVFRDITRRREAVREIRRQNRRAEVLVETAACLNAQIELTSVLDTISAICNQAMNASVTAVFLPAVGKDYFEIRSASTQVLLLKGNFRYTDYPLNGKVVRSILSAKKPVTILQAAQLHECVPYLDLFKDHNLHTLVAAGMYRRGELIGVLTCAYVGEPVPLPEDSLALLKGLADQAAASITNASLFEQVRASREQAKTLTTRLVEIQETERRHIARELHDQVGQVLTGLQFMLESAKGQAEDARTNQLKEAQDTVTGLIEQIREMSLNLRPSMLDDIGLLPTLTWHFERYTRQTGIQVSFTPFGVKQRLSPNVETTVYRIIQEALTNVARHAQVNEVFVYLVQREKVLEIEIIDHGVGFDTRPFTSKHRSAGLAGMQERANLMGGYLTIRSASGKGTQIKVLLPVDNQPVERRTHARHPDPGG